ncbi:ADP-ribose pyrophosphatase [Patulibacter medicamentivorans]|uniref:ADP-ribose pyrophosphatase n=1 Tax=Patulibacter medicamentivorans TaxID=1097667 RepID=H0E3Q9_9ACTN|nr:NUDIX hydrolase [Patulibacter medicamentivorans]EHN11679.1 ADP-ribose pyrophosphatase [Patulibacter medicamentivorans]
MSTAEERRFERVGGELLYDGRIVRLVEDRFRFANGDVVKREIIRHPGAVGILAHDGTHLWLTRQPRETIDDPDSLEIPAGKLDVVGEPPIECGRRELAEEIGRAAASWQPILAFQPSVGILDETVHLFCAWDLSEDHADSGEDERIEIVRWPIDDLDGAIAATNDGKTLIALLWAKANGLPGVA